MTTPIPADIANLTFDEALAELQRTVAELEAGGGPLEAAIAGYERGVALHEHCAGPAGRCRAAGPAPRRTCGRRACEAIELRAGEEADVRTGRGRLAERAGCAKTILTAP